MQMFSYRGTVSRAARVTLADEPMEIEAAAQDGSQEPWEPGW
jgi:hypothetical protein